MCGGGTKLLPLVRFWTGGIFFALKFKYLKKKRIYTVKPFYAGGNNLFLFIKLLAGLIVVLIIIGITLAAKMLEEDHRRKTRNYRISEEEKKRRSVYHIDDKDSFQSYRDKDNSYQDALRAVQGLRDRKDDKDGGGCPF